jgi:large subunit ribosomal protein L13
LSPDDAASPSSSSSAPPTPSPPAAPKKTTSKPVAKPLAPKPAGAPATPSSAPAPSTKSAPPKAAPAKKESPAPAKKEVAPEAKKGPSKWVKAPAPAKPAAGPAPKVVDATGLVLGRAASLLAKRLMLGETIVVVNTDKAVVLGSYADVVEKYRAAVARGSVRKGPHYPRRPDRMFRRTVRGMLPYRHPGGHEAWRRILTYVGVPEEFKSVPKETLESARARPSLRPPMTLGEISHRVGGVGPW